MATKTRNQTTQNQTRDNSWQPTAGVQTLMRFFEVNYSIPPALFLFFFSVGGLLVLGIVTVLVAAFLSTFAFI